MMPPSVDPSTEPGRLNTEQVSQVREHLHKVLASPAFSGGKRAQEFLRLIVDHALAGRGDSLKERMIGAEMFGRPVDYDTANDAVVRVKATEVRRRLAQYYLESKAELPVRIELPVGSYTPKFLWLTPAAEAADSRQGPAKSDEAEPPSLDRISLRSWILVGAAFGLLGVVGVYGYKRLTNPVAGVEIRSIAILPLVNLSGDPSQEYFADGMTEELIEELGRVPTLRVISRTSVMTYKGTNKKIPEIARELQVDGIIEGSIGREGNRVRINAQLVDSRLDKNIWTHSYDRDLTSVLELQSDVARAITDQIQIELTPQQQAQLKRTQQINPETVELYLKAMERMNSGDPKSAIDLFRGAIDKDPAYAPAHAGLANAYGWMGEAGWMSYSEAFSQQKAEALKAIQLDDSRPEPHLDLGAAAMNQSWDWDTQRKELQRALELSPNAAAVHWAYANYLNRVGLAADAVAQAKLAIQLDPVSSRSYMSTSFIYYYARQYDQALAQIQKAVALHPDPAEVFFPLGVIYAEKGQYDQAIQEFQRLGNVPHALGHMGNAYARAGRTSQAREIIPKLKTHVDTSGIGRYEIALVYAGLHENDKAFEWLEKAYQVRDKGLTYLKADPCLDPLRDDPRFHPLLQRVGFPPT
jgi:TolB-like protein/Tfp pilus assembly protein PilF